MSKRRQGQGCKCCKKPRPSQRRRKHLYVVLDDCHNGYTIHKLDLQDSSFYESSHDCTAELKCLPEPPALRLAQACHHDMFFAALGRYIFIANKRMYHAQPPALLYDTEAAALNVGPRLPGYLRESLVVAIPTAASSAGEYENVTQQEEKHLYAMTSQYDENKEHLLVSFKVMSWAPLLSKRPRHRPMDPEPRVVLEKRPLLPGTLLRDRRINHLLRGAPRRPHDLHLHRRQVRPASQNRHLLFRHQEL